MRMIRKNAAIVMTLVCLVFGIGSLSVNAVGSEICDTCKVSLIKNEQVVAHWQSTHEVKVVVDGALVQGTCVVTHLITHCSYHCPQCNRAWEENIQTETHSYIYCPDKK